MRNAATVLRRIATPLVVGVVVAAVLSGCSDRTSGAPPGAAPGTGDSSPSTRSTNDGAGANPPTGQPSTPLEVDPRVRRSAQESVREFLASTSRTLAEPESMSRNGLALTKQGSARAQLMNLAREYAEYGWSVRGRPRLVGLRVVARTSTPRTLTVAVCMDSSEVSVLDSNGDPAGPRANKTARSLNILTLVRAHGRWLVSDQTFPDDPSC